jgi:hypothetical protein
LKTLKKFDTTLKEAGEMESEWFLHHKNAPCQTSFAVHQFLADKKILTIPQSPYTLDIGPCNFWLFPNLKLGPKVKLL